MKTILINCSPKKQLSASSYFLSLQCFCLIGEKVRLPLRTKADYKPILNALPDADAVVFCMPLYVDSVPGHVIPFLKEMETFCKENQLSLKVYVISNNGFIEGNQNRVLMRIMENFCSRSNLQFGGGVGIGGGVMLNIERIVLIVQTAVFLADMTFRGVTAGVWFPWEMVSGFLNNVLTIMILQVGVLVYILRMGMFINQKKDSGVKYTRILLPSFVFILFADIFLTVISIFEGGIFKGWLSPHK